MTHDDGFNPLGNGPDLEIRLRTPAPAADLEEGSPCPTGCGGVMEFTRLGACSCHIAPPCSACGHEAEDA